MMRRWLVCISFFAAGLLAQQSGRTPPPAASSFQISGTVVNAVTTELVAGARVAISPASQRDAFTTVVTGEDGRFLFQGLPVGKYTLTAQHRGYLTQSFNQHGQYASSVAVGPDTDSGNLIFALIPEGAISGAVTDENGDAVREAQVTLFQSSNDDGTTHTSFRAVAITDDEGRYHFAHRRPGKYYIAVAAQAWYAQRPQTHWKVTNADGSTTYFQGSFPGPENAANVVIEQDPPSPLDVAYPLTFYAGTTDASAASPIVLGKGEKVSADVVVQPVPAVHLLMNVANADQTRSGMVGMEQKLFDGTPVAVPTQSTSFRPGMVEVTGVAPGHYTARTYLWDNADQAEKQDLQISESGVVEKTGITLLPLVATLSFQPPVQFSGQFSLQLRDTKTKQAFVERINGKGDIEFKQGIQRGSYEVSIGSTNDLFVQSIQASGARVNGRNLDVKGPAPVRLNVVLGQGRAEVSGLVLRNDKPVGGVMVVLVPAHPENNQVLFRRDQSNSDGSFQIGSVVPGRYTVLAIENGWDLEWANPAVLQKLMALGEPLTVEPKGKYSVKVRVQ
jgi:hypothetical protein